MGKIIDKNFWNKIDYNTYIKIRSGAVLGEYAAIIGTLLKNDILVSILVNSSFMVLIPWLYMQDVKTKDVKEVRELYDIFINNYSELNRVFELSDPLEIHDLFNKMVYGGFLSKDMTFTPTAENSREIRTLKGANICRGLGVCRHLSDILSDILNKTGIESETLAGKCDSIPMTLMFEAALYELVEEYRCSLEENSESFNKLLDNLSKESNFFPEYFIKNIPLPRGRSNHQITVAQKDNHVYYLDPMNKNVYHSIDESKNLILGGGLVMRLKGTKFKLDKYKNLLPTSKKDEMAAHANVEKIFTDNYDVFAKFYNDNKDIYEEIDAKMMKMSKRV